MHSDSDSAPQSSEYVMSTPCFIITLKAQSTGVTIRQIIINRKRFTPATKLIALNTPFCIIISTELAMQNAAINAANHFPPPK